MLSLIHIYLRGRLLDAYGRGDFKTYFDGLDHRPDRRELGEFAMDPIPLLSSLFHGCIEEGMSVLCQPIPDKNRGMNIGNPCEGVKMCIRDSDYGAGKRQNH